MANCVRCDRAPGFFSALDARGRCKDCRLAVDNAVQQFRSRFAAACADGIITAEEWSDLRGFADDHRVPLSEALASVSQEALQLIERWLAFYVSGGDVGAEEERYIALAASLQFDAATYAYVVGRFEYTRTLVRVRDGNVPVVRTAMLTEAGELCHLEIATTHVRQRKRGAQEILGKLVLTSRRLVFLSATGGFDVLWRKVRTCTASSDHVVVGTASTKGTGAFYVEDPLVAHAYIDALVRLDHRTLASARSESRRIPRDMAAAVWTRDRGRCNECGASPGPGVQLAFDHVIPFSLGGATTIENLQVLCTPCNLKKGSRL